MSTIKDHINGYVKFLYYADGNLWYKTTGTEFEFPVPLEDCGGAIFRAQDKAIFFMRWIRKHLETIKDGQGQNN